MKAVLEGPGRESWLQVACRHSSLTFVQLPPKQWGLRRNVASSVTNMQMIFLVPLVRGTLGEVLWLVSGICITVW